MDSEIGTPAVAKSQPRMEVPSTARTRPKVSRSLSPAVRRAGLAQSGCRSLIRSIAALMACSASGAWLVAYDRGGRAPNPSYTPLVDSSNAGNALAWPKYSSEQLVRIEFSHDKPGPGHVGRLLGIRRIADKAGHRGAAAVAGVGTLAEHFGGPIRVCLAHPTGVVADGAFAGGRHGD